MMPNLTQDYLKDVLNYDPETGVFTWKKKLNINKIIGSVAGCSTHNSGYYVLGLLGKTWSAHRLAWLYVHGEWPENIDHINQNKMDNRISNLRSVNDSVNGRNMPLYSTNTSGITGVRKSGNRWRAQMKVHDNFLSLGTYVDKFDAICARKSAERKYGFHVNHGSVNLRRSA